MLTDGGETIADLAVLGNQPALFGTVASDPSASRLLSQLRTTILAKLRAARAHAREVAWAEHLARRSPWRPAATDGGRPPRLRPGPGHRRDHRDMPLRVGISDPHLEESLRRPSAAVLLDNTGEALAGLLREGRAGSNTTADHITVWLGRVLSIIEARSPCRAAVVT
jgi:hypothetical protein